MTASPDLPGWRHVYSGKVRDLYEPTDGDTDRMLVVASDRVSAFDVVLSPGIPGKGSLLTTLSLWWFDRLAGADGGRRIPNHLAADDVVGDDDEPRSLIPDEVAGRAMVVRRLTMAPVECVVRGYLTGSGWAEYTESGTVCGIALPAGQQVQWKCIVRSESNPTQVKTWQPGGNNSVTVATGASTAGSF